MTNLVYNHPVTNADPFKPAASSSALRPNVFTTAAQAPTFATTTYPAGDTAELASEYEVQIADLDSSAASIQNSLSALNLAQTSVASLQTVIGQIQALSKQAALPTASPAGNAKLQTAITGLINEYNTIAANAQFNGMPLLAGTAQNSTPYIVESAAGGETNSATDTENVTATFSSPLTPGDLLVAVVGQPNSNVGGDPAPVTAPAGFTQIQNYNNDYNVGLDTYTAVVNSGSPTSYTFSIASQQTGNDASVIVLEIAGANSSDPVAASGVDATYPYGPGNPLETPAVTAPAANELPLGLFTSYVTYGTPAATNAGWSITVDNPVFHNPTIVETHALTTAGENLQAGYSAAENGPYGIAGLVLINPQTTTTQTASLTPADTPPGELIAGNLALLDASNLNLHTINVTQDPAAAEVTSAAAAQVLTQIQTRLSAIGTALTSGLTSIDGELYGTAAARESLLDNPPSLPDQALASLVKSATAALRAQANISKPNLVSLFGQGSR